MLNVYHITVQTAAARFVKKIITILLFVPSRAAHSQPGHQITEHYETVDMRVRKCQATNQPENDVYYSLILPEYTKSALEGKLNLREMS